MNDQTIGQFAHELVELAIMVGPEDEGIDVTDLELNLEDIVALKNRLSTMRKACDVVNNSLIKHWDETFSGESWTNEFNRYYVGRTKGKKVIDNDLFYAWLATLDADRLARIVSTSTIKVGGMNATERATFLDETPATERLSLKAVPLL